MTIFCGSFRSILIPSYGKGTFVHAGVEPPGTDCSLLETSRDTPYSRVIQITKGRGGGG